MRPLEKTKRKRKKKGRKKRKRKEKIEKERGKKGIREKGLLRWDWCSGTGPHRVGNRGALEEASRAGSSR